LEARAMIEAGQFGSELADSVHYIGVMLELAADELGRVGDAAGEYARELVPSMGDALAHLDPPVASPRAWERRSIGSMRYSSADNVDH
jgi:hypothetical protein